MHFLCRFKINIRKYYLEILNGRKMAQTHYESDIHADLLKGSQYLAHSCHCMFFSWRNCLFPFFGYSCNWSKGVWCGWVWWIGLGVVGGLGCGGVWWVGVVGGWSVLVYTYLSVQPSSSWTIFQMSMFKISSVKTIFSAKKCRNY